VSRSALGLDFGTESVRALIVDCETGIERAEAIRKYPHGVITDRLPGGKSSLPPEFALQHAGDYVACAIEAIQEALKHVPAADIIGVGVDFTACTILPIKADGTPLQMLPEFKDEPHAWVKLWKHHAAQPEADRVNSLAAQRGEKFLAYYGGQISSEWMLPKAWEIAKQAPQVYAAADLIIDAGDWMVYQLTGVMSRNSCAAGYKGLWNAELGFPSTEFLRALDPAIESLRDKWLQNIVAPGTSVGGISSAFAARSGLIPGTPVSAATIDAHSGVAGMGVYREGAFSVIMGTSSCHMVLSRELKLFNEGYAGVVKDGILPEFYGYESGQAAVGDIFGWFAREFGPREGDAFRQLSRGASQIKPGESGLIALDWMNGNRSVLMNSNLSGVVLGLTLDTKPHEIYRALIEATAFGSRRIFEAYKDQKIPLNEAVVCGGLTQDPFILQTYADVLGVPVKAAASTQAVALGAAIFGALAAGSSRGGFDDAETAVVRMTRPATRTYWPDPKTKSVYDSLYSMYLAAHDFFGRQKPELMTELKKLRSLS
jgi:L-ribulokinase